MSSSVLSPWGWKRRVAGYRLRGQRQAGREPDVSHVTRNERMPPFSHPVPFPQTPPTRREWRLPRSPRSARQARAVVRDYLSATQPRFLDQDAAELVVSELVSNAVLHAGDASREIALRMSVENGYLHVEVEDDDPRLPAPKVVPDDAIHGRGLQIIDRMAERWGWTKLNGDGKQVWCDLRGVSPD